MAGGGERTNGPKKDARLFSLTFDVLRHCRSKADVVRAIREAASLGERNCLRGVEVMDGSHGHGPWWGA